VNVASPNVITPVRCAEVAFAAADQLNVPFPVPDAPTGIVSHGESLTALRTQLELFAVIVTLPLSALERICWKFGDSVKLQSAF
jgi:hypothetical protein